MWKLKILTGELAGQSFSLHEGENSIGRSPQNEIRISSTGVSKQHCVLKVNGSAIAIKDLNSSNGSFVNGVKVEHSLLQVGDRIGIHNVVCELVFVVSQFQQNANSPGAGPSGFQTPPFTGATNFADPVSDSSEAGEEVTAPPKNLKESFEQYIEKVLLPGVYKLAQIFEFKSLLFSFVMLFIFVTTLLSLIPMLNITKDTIQRESGRRALAIARSLVKVNQEILGKGFQSQLTTRFAEREDGVQVALIIKAEDGSVMAPASEIGAYRNDPFIHRARKMEDEFVDQIDDQKMGASVPIRTYNRTTGNYSTSAYAVVIYNMGSLSLGEGKTISLFIQTLGMALALGAILFFFMYKLIERPFVLLTKGIDRALKGDSRSLEPEYQFPALEPLYTNINSLLNNNLSSSGGAGDSFSFQDPLEKKGEAKNLAMLFPTACLCMSGEGRFLALNSEAESLLLESEHNLVGQAIDAIGDMSLQLSLKDLWERIQNDRTQIQSNELEMNSNNCQIEAQAICSGANIDYIVVVFRFLQTEGDY